MNDIKQTKTTKPRRKRVTFKFEGASGSDVKVAGSFNNWDPKARSLKSKNDSGIFATTMLLPVGFYEYKFVVNGEWVCDPSGADSTYNDQGTMNSVIKVG